MWIILLAVIMQKLTYFQNYIFLVDVSGSMHQRKLDYLVKRDLKNYILSRQNGEKIVIIKFGDSYEEFINEVISDENKPLICRKIDALKFNQRYTRMWEAIDLALKRLKELYQAYPDRECRLYILTDGEPDYGNASPSVTASDIIKYYKENFQLVKPYIYLIKYGSKVQHPGLKEFASQTHAEIMDNIPPQAGGIPPFIQIKLLTRKIKIHPTAGLVERKFKILIREAWKSKNKKVFLSWKGNLPEGTEVEIYPNTFICTGKKEEKEFVLRLKGFKHTGVYKLGISFNAENVRLEVEPPDGQILILCKRPFPIWVLFAIAGVIVIFVVYSGICKSRETKNYIEVVIPEGKCRIFESGRRCQFMGNIPEKISFTIWHFLDEEKFEHYFEVSSGEGAAMRYEGRETDKIEIRDTNPKLIEFNRYKFEITVVDPVRGRISISILEEEKEEGT